MNGRGSSKRGGHASQLSALRSVLTATGGATKVEELYRLLTAEETAHFLAMSESQVRHLTCRHELPCIQTGRRGVAYRLIDLIEWQENLRRTVSF